MPSVNFELQRQERSNWCWAAVTVGVLRFFSPGSETRQCGIAHDEVDLRCCEDAERKCNQVRSLQPPLARIGRMRGEKRAAPLSFDEIRREIDHGRPVCARIGWKGGGGHFVVISGYDILPRMGQVVIVDDPQSGRSRLTYQVFLFKYRTSGEWTHTYPLTGSALNRAAS